MLGKLLKYEWKGLKKPIIIFSLIAFAATLIVSLVILTINPETFDNSVGMMIALILSILFYYLTIIVCTIGIPLVIAIRFYKTCYTDQGYLTHTLPVSTTKLLNAKILSGFLAQFWIVVLFGLSVIALIFVATTHFGSYYDINVFTELGSVIEEGSELYLRETGSPLTWLIVKLIVFFICSMFGAVSLTYGCISLGQLYTKHRVLGAIIAYIGVMFITQNITTIYLILKTATDIESYEYSYGWFASTYKMSFGVTFVIGLVMYFINLHMMSKKLNLE